MTTLNIRIRALEHNIEIIKSLAADAQIIAVLKGNAYGLGLCKFATFLQARGIRHFAVTELADAIELREKGIFGEILLLTPLYHPEDITRAIKHDITLSITSVSCGQILEDTAARLNHFCAMRICASIQALGVMVSYAAKPRRLATSSTLYMP